MASQTPSSSSSSGSSRHDSRESPVPSGSAQTSNIVAQLLSQIGPVMQIDQMVPAFYGEKDKDALTVVGWCIRIDAMKTSLSWNDEQTFYNATLGLLGIAQRVVAYWDILDKTNYARTWTYLKKAMIEHWGARSYMDAVFSIRKMTDPFDDLDAYTSEVMEAFWIVRETLPRTDAPMIVANRGNYTDAQVNTMLNTAYDNVIDQFCMAFFVNYLHPDLRSKVMEKNFATIKDCITVAAECQRFLRNKNRPVGAPPKTRGLAADKDLQNPQRDDAVINKAQRHFNKSNNPGGPNKSNKGKGKSSQSSNNQSGNPLPRKKCNYCGKFGHGAIDCYSRKNDNAPCYNGKGEPYFPKGETFGGQQGSTHSGSFKLAAPLPTAKPKDFPQWV